jgi:hypothetical protein
MEPEEVYNEAPDLSRGVEGVHYYITYGTEGDDERAKMKGLVWSTKGG